MHGHTAEWTHISAVLGHPGDTSTHGQSTRGQVTPMHCLTATLKRIRNCSTDKADSLLLLQTTSLPSAESYTSAWVYNLSPSWLSVSWFVGKMSCKLFPSPMITVEEHLVLARNDNLTMLFLPVTSEEAASAISQQTFHFSHCNNSQTVMYAIHSEISPQTFHFSHCNNSQTVTYAMHSVIPHSVKCWKQPEPSKHLYATFAARVKKDSNSSPTQKNGCKKFKKAVEIALWKCSSNTINKAVIDCRLFPRCCQLESYFKHTSFSCRYICMDIMCKHDVINIQHTH